MWNVYLVRIILPNAHRLCPNSPWGERGGRVARTECKWHWCTRYCGNRRGNGIADNGLVYPCRRLSDEREIPLLNVVTELDDRVSLPFPLWRTFRSRISLPGPAIPHDSIRHCERVSTGVSWRKISGFPFIFVPLKSKMEFRIQLWRLNGIRRGDH